MKDFMSLAAERYSVRKFRNEPVAQEAIDKILRAGHLAPTGCNFQPQRIYVIRSAEGMDKLRACTKCHFDAPMAMLVCYDKTECWTRRYDGEQAGWTDASIVATHMMLQAHDIGVGTTWVMHFDPFAVREAFSLHEQIVPVALMPMGYPAEDAQPHPLHSQMRPMEEVVSYL